MERDVPKEIVERSKAWRFYFGFWYAVHYTLGVVAILSSLTVAYLAFAVQGRALIAGFSLVAAICTALNYFLFPYRNAQGYVKAWRQITSAMIKYRTDPNTDVGILHRAIDEGESKIAKTR